LVILRLAAAIRATRCRSRTPCAITWLEWRDQGHDPRFVVNHVAGDPGTLCGQRGEAENRIMEARADTRRIRLYFASNWPCAPTFALAMRALGAAQRFIDCLARALRPQRPAARGEAGEMATRSPPSPPRAGQRRPTGA
jgi:hypothetical protein